MIVENGYKSTAQKKKQILQVRMDDIMISQLNEIRDTCGISCSEIIRCAVRDLLAKARENGTIKLI